MSRPHCSSPSSLSVSNDRLSLRLQNVFRILGEPSHQLRQEAFALREEVSSVWAARAAQDNWFPWPTTVSPKGKRRLSSIAWRQHGMLSFLGYHVGEIQPTRRSKRQRILEYVFECHLPPLNDRAYYLEWGSPSTSRRLQKLANTLAAFTRNAKRRDEIALARAIDDWEDDLAFLHDRYYVPFFHFGWPAPISLH